MAYKDKYLNDLNEIIKLINEEKIIGKDGAIEKFKLHVKDVVNIGRFSPIDWDENWRKSVYKFGIKFKEIDPVEFLKTLHESSLLLHKDQQEVLDFYCSEIEYNSLSEDICTKRFEELIQKHPYNPEFRHTLGHFYVEKKMYVNAIEQYRFAFNKDKMNDTFESTLFNTYKIYCDTLIEKEEYVAALNVCDKLLDEALFKESVNFNNILLSTKDRIKDYIVLNKKIIKAEEDLKSKVEEATKSWQFKTIEILSFFSAIIAFIFSTISIGKNFNFIQALVFNIALGFTLLLFVLVLNLIFSERNSIKKSDFRIILVGIFTIALLALILVAKFGLTTLLPKL